MSQAVQSAVVAYSCAGRLRTLPVAVVREIGRATDAALVPFAPFAFEGLVETGDGLAAQVDLTQAMGGTPRTAETVILLQTKTGLVRVRVDTAALAAESNEEIGPSGLAEIEALIAPLAPAEPVLEVTATKAATSRSTPAFHALIVASGKTRIALSVTEVERVERHGGARKTRKGKGRERIVTVDDTLVPGWSLAAWLGQDVPIESETWAVLVHANGQRVFLIVEKVLGIVSVPIDRIQDVRHGKQASFWLTDPIHGEVEVVKAAEIIGEPEAPAAETDTGSRQPLTWSDEERIAHQGALGVGFGQFTAVFPRDMILGVLEKDRFSVLSRRTQQASPRLNAARLLGLSGFETMPGRTLMLRRPWRRPLAMVVPEIGFVPTVPAWRPLPLVPLAVRSLFQSVRFRNAACDFLVRETLLASSRDPIVRTLLKSAQMGWLEVA